MDHDDRSNGDITDTNPRVPVKDANPPRDRSEEIERHLQEAIDLATD